MFHLQGMCLPGCHIQQIINLQWSQKKLKLTDLVQSSYFTNGETRVEEHWVIFPGLTAHEEAEPGIEP